MRVSKKKKKNDKKDAYLPGPSSTDKGFPDLNTGSPTVKPPIHFIKRKDRVSKDMKHLSRYIPVSS